MMETTRAREVFTASAALIALPLGDGENPNGDKQDKGDECQPLEEALSPAYSLVEIVGHSSIHVSMLLRECTPVEAGILNFFESEFSE